MIDAENSSEKNKMTEEYKDWYKSRRNHLFTLGAITLMSLGTSLYGYKNMKNIDRSLANHSLEKTVVTSLEEERETYKSMALAGGVICGFSFIFGLGAIGTRPEDF